MAPTTPKPRISVVIPTWNEAPYIAACIESVVKALPDAEILVVDGGSTDATRDLASQGGALVLMAPRGRGTQCNVGGRSAVGDIILFLHADTALPGDAGERITEGFHDPEMQVAMFRLSFDQEHPLLKFYSFFTRFDSEWYKFGDQAIVLRRDLFWRMGGFPDWPLLEDVEFLRRVRLATRIRIFPSAVITSSRRLRRDGLVRRQIINAWLLIRFKFGTSSHELAREYDGEPTPAKPMRAREADHNKEPALDQYRLTPIHGNH